MQRSFDIDENEYPFTSHWLPYKDGSIHYIDEGEGLPVVMLHGNPTWSFLYRHVIKTLPNTLRSIAIDYPGFGYSTLLGDYNYTAPEHADAVIAVLDALKLDRYILVLQDWGGPIGLSVATRRSEQVAGLVICNTWCWAPSFGMKLFSWSMGGPLGRYLIRNHNLFAKAFMKGALEFETKQAQPILDAYTKPFPSKDSRIGTWVFPKEITRQTQWLKKTSEQLAKIGHIPTEFVWGMKDPAFRHRVFLDAWQQHFPQARWTKVENASHFLQETAYREIAQAILRLANLP